MQMIVGCAVSRMYLAVTLYNCTARLLVQVFVWILAILRDLLYCTLIRLQLLSIFQFINYQSYHWHCILTGLYSKLQKEYVCNVHVSKPMCFK